MPALFRLTTTLCTLLLCLAACSTCLAQQPPPNDPPPRIDFATALSLDAKTGQAVNRIMREQHDKMDALRKETDSQLAKVLSAAQIEKLHQLIRKSRPADGPPPRN